MAAAGWHVEAAADGGQALLAASAFKPDAIILDLHLPLLDGLDVARAVRSMEGFVRVSLVACTAYLHLLSDSEVRTAFDALVAKPCDPEALRTIVENLVGALPGPLGS